METSSASQTLCLSCGLCCNGGLHNWTNLRLSEVNLAKKFNLQVFDLPQGTPAFLQPCAAFDIPICSIYEHRPQSCRDYRCKLLIALEQAEIQLEDALRLTRRAGELIATLRSQMPEADPNLSLERQVRYQWPDALPPPEAVAILTELVELLESHWGVRWRPFSRRHTRQRR